uniref:Sepiapterin reductase n=1 Tax=Leptobrachium leishanense TaxID=445787 RepID=A0A8C5QP78_9ANUR
MSQTKHEWRSRVSCLAWSCSLQPHPVVPDCPAVLAHAHSAGSDAHGVLWFEPPRSSFFPLVARCCQVMSETPDLASPPDLGIVSCVLSGGSRGLGRSLASELCARFQPGSELLLVARTESLLRHLAEELNRSHPGVTVSWHVADLGTDEGICGVAAEAKRGFRNHSQAGRLLIINNAGSLGDVKKFFLDFTKPDDMTVYLSLNVSSAMCFTSSLLRAFPGRPGLQRIVVNISSLAALHPFKSWSLYCTGKAAREMMFKVLAAEQKNIRVLSYAPGPLDTEMHELARAESADPELRQFLANQKDDDKLVDCDVTVRKLVGILLADSFESGAHIDFYDEV